MTTESALILRCIITEHEEGMEVISKPSLGCNESPEPASFGLLLYPPGQQTRRAVLPPDCSGERIGLLVKRDGSASKSPAFLGG